MGKNEDKIWLVYSREHNAWWRPNSAGYCCKIEQAGRYTKAEAEEICLQAGNSTSDPGPSEFMMLAPKESVQGPNGYRFIVTWEATWLNTKKDKTRRHTTKTYSEAELLMKRMAKRGIQTQWKRVFWCEACHREIEACVCKPLSPVSRK